MAKKTHLKVRMVPESNPDSKFIYYAKKPTKGEKVKDKLKLKKYKEYVPIGYNCFTGILLVNLGLRKNAYPLDWVICNPVQVLQYFKTNFENYYLPSADSNTNYMNQE